jgi:hypothetical protein
MIRIVLQTLPGLCLLAAAFYAQASCWIRKRYASWEEIMGDFDALDGRLASLSHHDLLSNGLAIEEGDVWDHIARWRGLVAMHRNAGLFIVALEWMESESSCSPEFSRSARIARSSACALRLAIYASFLHCSARMVFGAQQDRGVEAARRYISVRARFALLVQDYRPDKFKEMRLCLAVPRPIYRRAF